jgi:hypothetical protein
VLRLGQGWLFVAGKNTQGRRRNEGGERRVDRQS